LLPAIPLRLPEDSEAAATAFPRTTPARAKSLLRRLGTPGALRDDDRLDEFDETVG
jgi:hypothetical protein